MFVQLPWLLQGRMLADPVFIIVNPHEVVGRAEEHGPGNSDIYHKAVNYANDNQVIIFIGGGGVTKSILYF